MNICVVGTGYVGLVTGACLAQVGHTVVCVDNDGEKVRVLRSGQIPIYEPGLLEIVARNRSRPGGGITFTDDMAEGIRASSVIFICVGTPPLENGEADLSAVEKVTRWVAETAARDTLIVEKSTVPVQTGMWVEKTLQVYGRGRGVTFLVASNPEFLREGSAVEDFLHPDRIVVGVDSPSGEKAVEILRELYRPIVEGTFDCPLHTPCERRAPVPFLVTDIRSAELIKHASNAFLALKISFINAVADICELVGADITAVAGGVGADHRIGRTFLHAGIGFGGFCLPKDLQAFVRIAEKWGYDFTLLREAERINRDRIPHLLRKLTDELWILRGKSVGVLGLAFKPNTDDIRFSQALEVVRRLQEEGATVRAYDPQAMRSARAQCPEMVVCQDPYEAATGCEALFFLTEWEEFRALDLSRLKAAMTRPLIVDARNMLDKAQVVKAGFTYIGMGR